VSGVTDGEFHRTLLLPGDIAHEQSEILFRNLKKIELFYIKVKVSDIFFEFKEIHKIRCIFQFKCSIFVIIFLILIKDGLRIINKNILFHSILF
jgi:hypothetical protein